MYEFEGGLQTRNDDDAKARLSRHIDSMRASIASKWGMEESTDTVFSIVDGWLHAGFRYDSEGWHNALLE